MIDIIKDFIFLQNGLVSSLCNLYPDSKDLNFLLDFPKKGQFEFNSDEWSFHRHGVGFVFKNIENNVIVDVHDNFVEPNYFDSWRLQRYIESLGAKNSLEKFKNTISQLLSEKKLKEFEGGYIYLDH